MRSKSNGKSRAAFALLAFAKQKQVLYGAEQANFRFTESSSKSKQSKSKRNSVALEKLEQGRTERVSLKQNFV